MLCRELRARSDPREVSPATVEAKLLEAARLALLIA
jgi:hypothetical protein